MAFFVLTIGNISGIIKTDFREDDGLVFYGETGMKKVDRTMNYTEEICEMLGIEVNKPFRLMGRDYRHYRINEDCLTEWDYDGKGFRWLPSSMILIQLLEGLIEVDWIPEVGEDYYYPTKDGIEIATWMNSGFDNKNREIAGVYKNKNRAEKKRMKLWGEE